MSLGVPSSSPRSHRGRRAGLTAVLAGALVAGSAVVATSVAAPASADNLYSNLITLQTGAKNEWKLYPTDTKVAPSTQGISATSSGNCTIKTPTGTIADLGGSKKAGLRSGSIGIADKTSGESCAQVSASPSETLTIDLKGKDIDLAVLDVELQKDAVILAAAFNGPTDTTPVYFELQSGSNITANGSTKSGKTATVAKCQVDTSSGPNSNVNDNCRWVIEDTVFDRISLTAVAGQFSLEGGADGTVTRRTGPEPSGTPANLSYVRIAETLDCNESTFTLPISGIAPQVSVDRLGNADPTQTCEGFTYELTNTSAQVNFIKPFDTQTSVQFVMNLVWPITGVVADLPPVKFSFHNSDGLLSGTTYTLDWCRNTQYDANGKVTGLNPNPLFNASIADMETGPGYPGKQYACVVPRTQLLVDAGNNPTGWTQQIYILGDAYARR